MYHTDYSSPIGTISITSDGEALTGLSFRKQGECLYNASQNELPVFIQTRRWLDIYFSGNIPDFTPPINIQANAFRKMVYDILLTIPYGQTMTYGEIAHIIAERNGTGRMSAQAIGGAVGSNPVGIIIPCHRVLGAGGKLTGYAAGLDKKRYLLSLERIPFRE